MKKILVLVGCFLLVFGISFGQKKGRNISVQTNSSVSFQIENATSFSDGRKVWLGWQTKNESEILGYNIYRANGISMKKKQVNASIIAGSVMSSNGRISEKDYSFIDSEGNLNSVYYIESIDIHGKRTGFPPIYPQFTNDTNNFKGDNLNANVRIEKSETIVPPDADIQNTTNSLMTAEDTQHWVAAQPGVKIVVNREGFYRVTKSALQSAGFNIASNEANWQLYADGIEQAILVNANDIEFYGRGIDTISTDKRVYYLVLGTTAGKRITPINRKQIRGYNLGQGFDNSIEFKDKLSYASGILNGDDDNYFGKIVIGSASTPTPTDMVLNIPGVSQYAEKNSVEINIQPLTDGAHSVKVNFNGQQIGTVTGQDKVAIRQEIGLPVEMMNSGNNTLQLVALGGSNDIDIVISVKVNYKRKYEASQNQLNFYTPLYQKTQIDGFTSSNIRIFDISDITNPRLINSTQISQNGATYSAILPSNRINPMYAVEESGIKSPVSITANTPSTLSAGSRNANMIIITHSAFEAQANTWKTYRQNQGLSVEVVNIDDIFDEFNFGYTQPDGIRTFLQYAYNNWQNVKYVLILGDATYDYRGYSNNPFANYVPTRLVDTVYIETGSDETLADFNNDGLAEIAVGRIPVRDTASLTTVFNKITGFENGVLNGLVNRGSLFVSDEPNGYDFQSISQRISSELPTNIPKSFTYKPDPNSRTDTLNNLNQGKFTVNWSGHGNTAVWSANTFVNKTDMAALINSNYTIFTLLTCLNGYFVDSSANDVFAEVALKNPNGGAAAVWASAGLTTADVQEVMARRFYYLLGNDPNFVRIGDIIRDAKTTIPFGRDVRLTWSLLGDPAMKVR
jgi:hypothetical protein